MITQLDTENADLNLVAYVLALTNTPDISNPVMCKLLVLLGDGTKNLDGTGGIFKIKINLGSQESDELSFTITAGDTRVTIWSDEFPVPANTVVTAYLLSPNAADTDVDITAYLYDVDPLSITPTQPTGVASILRDMLQQTWRRFFKKATQTATEIKCYKDDGSSVTTTQTISDDNVTQTQGASN